MSTMPYFSQTSAKYCASSGPVGCRVDQSCLGEKEKEYKSAGLICVSRSLKYQSTSAHITSNSRIPINPPRPSNTGLSIEKPELIKTQDLFQPTSHGDARLASTDYNDGDVRVGIFAICVTFVDFCWGRHRVLVLWRDMMGYDGILDSIIINLGVDAISPLPRINKRGRA